MSRITHKIAHLTSAHSRYDNRIFVKECRSLAQQGYDVSLVVADGRGDEVKDSVHIFDVGAKRHGRLSRMTRTVKRVFQKARELNADIYHFHDPELITAALLLRASGKKLVYDMHENLSAQTYVKHYLPGFTKRFIAIAALALEWFGAKICNAIVAATPGIASKLPPDKTITAQNFPIEAELVDYATAPYDRRPPSFAYVGGISAARGAIESIRAFEFLNDIRDVKLELAGFFTPDSLADQVRAFPGWRSVNYHGLVSRTEVANILYGVRAGLILFHPLPNHTDAQPNKMFEYMSAGLPVIASDFPLWRQIIEGVGCGLLADPLNPESIAGAMRWVLDHPAEAKLMGQRGRQAVEQIYNWGAEAPKLIGLYAKLLNSQSGETIT